MKKHLLALLVVAAFGAQAQTTVKDPWVRGTVAGQKATGMFAQVTSTSGGKLVAASSPAAGVVEIHEMAMDGNVMKMRAVPGIDLLRCVSDIRLQMNAEVGVPSPVAINPTIRPKGRLQVLPDIVQLVLAVLCPSCSRADTVDAGLDMTLMPFRLRCLHSARGCETYHPLVRIAGPQLDEASLVHDAQKLLN